MFKEFNSLLELITVFPDEQTCIEYLEYVRWEGNVISPYDPSSKVYKCKGNNYKCKNTGQYFNVKTGTMFHRSSIPLQKWFVAIWLVTSHKKGISSVQLGKDISVTQKTAWFMLQRIREAFSDKNLDDYIRLKTTDEFMKELSKEINIPVSDLVQPFESRNRTINGTWVHP